MDSLCENSVENLPVLSVDTNANDEGAIGVSILVVDCDSTCLAIVSKMLHIFGHKVIPATRAIDALRILRERREKLDLILTEVRLPDIDKYELLETMGEISCLPIVILSADNNENVMLGCLFKGALFYLVKPITMNDVKTLWQFSYMKNQNRNFAAEGSRSCQGHQSHPPLDAVSKDASDCLSDLDICDQNVQNGKRKEPEPMDENEQDNVSSTVQKKPKLIWTNELHDRFLQAITTFGIESAHPKKILEYMNVPGLKKEHISSHLQKYRLSLKREQHAAENTMFGDDHLSPWHILGGPSELLMAELLMNTSQPEFRSYFENQRNGNNPSMSISSLRSGNYPVSMKFSPLSDQINSTHTSSSPAGTRINSFEELGSFDHMRNDNVEVFSNYGAALSNVESSGFEIASDGMEILGGSPQQQEQYMLPPLSPLQLAWEQEEDNIVEAERVEADELFDIAAFFGEMFHD